MLNLLVVCACLSSPCSIAAQTSWPERVAAPYESSARQQEGYRWTAGMAAVGLGAGAGAFWLGAVAADRRSNDIGVILASGLLASSIVMPVAMYGANRGRGNLPLSMAASVGIGVLGGGATYVMDRSAERNPLIVPVAVAVPVSQILAILAIERGGTR